MATRMSNDTSELCAFNVNGEASSIAAKWKGWRRAFKLYIAGKDIKDDKQRKALLLHIAGLAVPEIYYALVSEETDKKSFTEILAVLDNDFIPKANVHFERHKLYQIAQTKEESTDDFLCKLRLAAATCEFGDNVDERLRDQIISKCFSNSLRRKFLEKETLTLKNVVNIAKAHETINSQIQAMESAPKPVELNVLRKGTARSSFMAEAKGKECYACGN